MDELNNITELKYTGEPQKTGSLPSMTGRRRKDNELIS